MLEGKISLKLIDDQITLVSEVDKRKVFELPLNDDYYQSDIMSQAQNLLGQCMHIIEQCTNKETMKCLVEEELQNWGDFYVEEK